MARILPIVGLALAMAPAAAMASEPAGRPAGEGPDCAARVAARVQAYYERVQDLQASFTQTTQSVTLGAGGGAATQASGRVTFAKPGRMRWAYETPERSLVVTDGETLWIYDPAAAEVQRMSVTGAFLSGAAIQFLLGEGDLQHEFEISSPECTEAAASGSSGHHRQVVLELLPRAPAHYEKLSVRVDAASGQVYETVVQDLFGNRTRVELRDVEIDRHPAPESFHFDPPAGVRVIDLSAPPASSQ